ncbi:putative aliphatic sulfonates transport permease protein SsuC [compost metagenome]
MIRSPHTYSYRTSGGVHFRVFTEQNASFFISFFRKRNPHMMQIAAANTKKTTRKSPLWYHLLPWLLPVLILLIWQTISSLGWLTVAQLPSPLVILKQFIHLAGKGTLFIHLKISTERALTGFLIGGTLGLIAGIFSGLGKLVERTVDPMIQMLRTVPHLIIAPLFIMWFGIDELSKVLLISFGAFFPMYINTYLGIRSVDSKMFEVTQVLQFSRFQQIIKLVIPSALPNILLGVRLSLGISWLGLVVAELMGSSSGVGYMIQDARQFSQTDIVFVGILLFALVGKLSDSLVRLLEWKFLRWRDTYKG